eukprot:GHVU01137094.1.p1 GENE.GHVU01137094.1~~GHVU01137094.1.p1  ORF type:complete len:177 (+),score=7.89 GHVU01137094.1:257-787(+)
MGNCFTYRNRPPGGGPAPLLKHPDPPMAVNVAIVHIVLMVLAMLAVVVPLLWDLGCTNTAAIGYGVIVLVQSFCVVIYFGLTSLRTLGDEGEWGELVTVTVALALIDFFSVGFGVYVVYQDGKELTKEGVCNPLGNFVLYLIVLLLHTGAMVFCIYATSRFLSNIVEQFKVWQHVK